jgi:predicted nucleic acid-binding protein
VSEVRAVFDTSALVPLFIPSALTEAAISRVAEFEVVSLSFAPVEFASAIVQQVRADRFSVADGTAAIEKFRGLSSWLDMTLFLEPAVPLAVRRKHGVYDCFYVAAAESLSLPLVTADKKLVTKFRDDVPAGILNLYDEIR